MNRAREEPPQHGPAGEVEDVLRSPEAGALVIRGGALRAGGYAAGVLLTAVASVFLLRYLGVAVFGQYVTVLSLIAIVSGVTDAGLTAVGARDLAVHKSGAERRRLLANLLGLRLVLTPLGVLGAAGFALLAGYDRALVLGTLVGGAGLVLINAQATMMLPLSVGLRIGRLTAAEVLKQAVAVIAIGVLVAAGASLLPFFTVQVVVGAAVLAVTPWLLRRDEVVAPAFDRLAWASILRAALPIAAFLVMGVVYFRVLVILTSLLSTEIETGLFATSFRIFEILFGIPVLIFSVALPVLAASGRDLARVRYQVQRMSEVAAISAALLVVVVVALAEPLIVLAGGADYRDAAPLLQIQALALIPVFFGQVWQLALIAIRRQAGLALANGGALLVVLVLGGVLIPRFDSTGAAVAAVVAEFVLAAGLLALLAGADRALIPSFRFAWKVVAASGLAALVLLAPAPAVVLAVGAVVAYAAVIWLTGALPAEVAAAFPRRRPARS